MKHGTDLIDARVDSRRAARPNLRVSGFTFAEVLAAMVFIAVVIPVAMRGLATANRVGVVAERGGLATQLAEQKLNELVVTDEWRNSQKQGDFGEEYPGYRWILEDSAWEADTMKVVSVEVFFPAQGREYSVVLSTLVEEAEQ